MSPEASQQYVRHTLLPEWGVRYVGEDANMNDKWDTAPMNNFARRANAAKTVSVVGGATRPVPAESPTTCSAIVRSV